MKYWLLYIVLICFYIRANGEGTRELRPTATSYGNLHFNDDANIGGTNIPMYTNFGMYDAPESEQIKIRINSLDETIFYGLNNKQINGGTAFIPNVPYRIKDPAGNIVVDNVTIPAAGQEGHIATWNQAVAGPIELGNPNGYDALEYKPLMTGDYIIEFNPSGSMDIHLFDITVANGAMEPQNGRLHSQGWQISTDGGSNPFSGKVYPYDPRGVIYEVDFNDTQPYTFVINFNSTGTGVTGNYLEDRKSKIGKNNYSIPEFEVFLNPPDETSFPTFTQEGHFSGVAVYNGCGENSYCFNYTSDVSGILDGFIDIDGDNFYDPAIDVYFSKEFIKDTTICIPWDGNDMQGNRVDPENVQILASFGLSVTHLPVFDVEHNRGGLMVKIVSPANLPEPLLYWDDSNIPDNRNLDAKINLSGCSSLNSGCHRWQNRGNNNNPETINTWWYTKVLFDTITLSSVYNPQVMLSFNENVASLSDTSICSGDSIHIYIHNDGEHFNTSVFKYVWSVNGTEITEHGGRQLKEKIDNETQISIVSSLISDPTCITYDTLTIAVANPVTITASVTDEDCLGNKGLVSVQVTDGPPNVRFIWGDDPVSSNVRNNLDAGEYYLTIADPDYSDRCALDTSFIVGRINPFAIDELNISPSVCYHATGSATVRMNDPSLSYTYSWSGSLQTTSTVTDLSTGQQTVTVTETLSGCSVDSVFMIESLPLEITLSFKDDTCSSSEGEIVLSTPGKDFFSINFNGSAHSDTVYQNLLHGNYTLNVVAHLDNTCRVDTNISIANQQIEPKPAIVTEAVVCGMPTGTARIIMPEDGRLYQYAWMGGAWEQENFRSNLSKGEYSLSVGIAGSSCQLDTSFVIDGTDAIAIDELILVNTPCYDEAGRAEVTMIDPLKSYLYKWDTEQPVLSSERDQLAAGNHVLVVTETLTGCMDDTVFTIQADPFTIDINTTNEVCNAGNATAVLSVPPGNFTIFWDGVSSNSIEQSGLSAGVLSIQVVAVNTPGCRVDTSVTIVNEDRPVLIDDILVTHSECYKHTGSVSINMVSSLTEYRYSINQGPLSVSSDFAGLTPGTHVIQIQEAGTNCRKDTSVYIEARFLNFEANVQEDFCGASTGSIEIPVYVNHMEITWADGFTGNIRTQLAEGAYPVRIRNTNAPVCIIDTIIQVSGRTYQVPADFSYTSSYNMVTDFPVDFQNLTSGNLSITRWDFGDNKQSSDFNPSHIYTDEGEYEVRLFVKDENGCEGTVSRWLSVKKYIPCEVVLPNAFSPNNDQYNDYIGLLGFAHKVDLVIFNRWGEVIFRTGTFDDRWDGTYLQTEAPIGVYPYILEYECEDFSGSTVKNKTIGEITLIR